MATDGLTIIGLNVENVKNLSAVRLTLSPHGLVVLTGKNGAGKSSVIDSIWMALSGKKQAHPVKVGHDKGVIEVDLGDYKVRRVLRDGKASSLTVKSSNGATYPSPQALLTKWLGEFSFDPLEFANMPAAKQRDLLLQLAGLDLDAIDTERESLYEDRRAAKRDLKALIDVFDDASTKVARKMHELDAAGIVSDGARIDVQNLVALHRKLSDQRDKHTTTANRIEQLDREIVSAKLQITRLEEQIAAHRNRITELDAEKESVVKTQVDMPDESEFTSVQEQLQNATAINALADLVDHSASAKEKLDKQETIVNEMERLMSEIDQRKQDMFDNASFPVDKLGVSDDAVIYDGIPFEQLSSGTQLRISTRIAMALNPTIRVIMIREGSLLDNDGVGVIAKLADEHGYQVLLERVTDSAGEVGIHIVDGEVTAVDGQPVSTQLMSARSMS